jgi:phosphomannomutase
LTWHYSRMDTTDAVTRAHAWLAEDPDPQTRAELAALIAAGDTAAINERFSGRLEFGTAGLRGALGAGPQRMNRVVVIRAAAGLAAYLAERSAHGLPAPGTLVVIGYDARHNSEVFAQDTAAVLTGAGFRAALLPRPLPTPVLAFAIRHLGAIAGVMVTASHNPPQDNGYKVYLGDGSQIVPPADVEISAAIDAVGALSSVPLGDGGEVLDDAVEEAYLDRIATVVVPGGPRELRVVATPLHGVGGATLRAALTRAGFAEPVMVTEQAEPDPDFPTVAFPNPEEPGAMDLAFATGTDNAADLIIANDPDADRCAVAVPTPAGWRMLRGDEVGWLLATHLVGRGRRGMLATSIVSSSLLREIAQRNDCEFTQTLTGFKWIGRLPGLIFGYEEALGYSVDPEAVGDKDGISAAVAICELAAELKAADRTLADALDDIALEYGVYATAQLPVRFARISDVEPIMAILRATPPSDLAGLTVVGMDDLSAPTDGLPPTDGVRLQLAERARVIVRPSGTEAKLKCYFEVVVDVDPSAPADDALTAARAVAADRLGALRVDLSAALGLPGKG